MIGVCMRDERLNRIPGAALNLLILVILLILLGTSAALLAAREAAALVYDVGPAHPYPAIGEVPWESLAPGDTVRIHHRAEPYHEKWVLCRSGTSAQPIVVQGIPSAGGDLPIVSGIDATTRAELNFWNENRGIIKIGGANNPPDTMPKWIIIEGLEIQSGRPPYTFTGRNGLTPYASNCASIYVEKGEEIVIRGCRLADCGNGFFCASGATGLLLEGNTIVDNGIEGSIYEHNNYTEARGITFQFNHFGPLREGCLGNNLKDRSAGAVIRYNWIESGNRQLDLVDSDDPLLYNDPSYRQTLVYGNILVEPEGAGNSQILHYGGDSGETAHYRKGTLHLYHNTIVSTRSGNTTLARLSTAEERCDARNNILYVSAAGSRLAMLAESGGTIELRNNWLKPGWVASHSGGPGVVLDHGNVEGSDPGFVDLAVWDLELLGSSACIDAGGPLVPELLPVHQPRMEYVRHARARPRPDDGAIDIGAYEWPGTTAVGDEEAEAPGPRGTVLVWPNPSTMSVRLAAPRGCRLQVVGVDGRIWLDHAPAAPPAGVTTIDAWGGGAAGAIEWRPPAEMPAGIYLVVARHGEWVAVGRMVRLRPGGSRAPQR